MYIQGRVKSIKIIPQTSGANVEVAYDKGNYTGNTEESYACVDMADTKFVVGEWLAEIFREQKEYFEVPEGSVKLKRKASSITIKGKL